MSKKQPKRKKAAPKRRRRASSKALEQLTGQTLPVYGAKGEVAVIQPKGAPVIGGDPPTTLEELTDAQRLFALEYLQNGFNAAGAYAKGHPDANPDSSAVGGWRMLRNVKVARYLKSRTETIWKDLQVGSEEALARLGFVAIFDVTLLFDKNNNLLPMSQWPEHAGTIIESIDVERGKLKLPSRLVALRTLLEQSGKLKSLAGGIDELAEAIRADKAEHLGGQA